MPATRTRKATPKRLNAVGQPTAEPLQRLIRNEVSTRIRERLRLTDGEPIPQRIQELVDAATRDVTENAVEIAVIREVEEAARYLRGAESSGVLTTRPDLGTLQGAENLAVKTKALQAAGFSRDEAMRILVADIAAAGGVAWA